MQAGGGEGGSGDREDSARDFYREKESDQRKRRRRTGRPEAEIPTG
jgi:hypothetical protein